MNLTVFIEPLNGGFRASTSQPVPLETHGASREEALKSLQDMAATRIGAGEIVELTVPQPQAEHPLQRFAGIWKDHPDLPEYLAAVAEYRRIANSWESEP
ncbi:MAG: hypothetical protein SFV23_01545 [Planctomycetaceae bacterium]|nr:hypothetical protein [Planctomycetaceae bacterium]